MSRTVITRVTETDFQTEDGRIVPHAVPFLKGEAPSVMDLQKQYDYWFRVFQAQGILSDPIEEEPDVQE